MLGITDFWAFAAAILIFLMLPGPGTFALLTSSAQSGLRGGYAALAGLMLGDFLLMSSAIAGLAAIMAAHPGLFRAVQYLGVAYLIWTGVQMIRRPAGGGATLLPIRQRHYFRQSFLITLINPKAIGFYMAFFPQFIDPAGYQGATTFGLMVLTVGVITLAYGSFLVLTGNWMASRLSRHQRLGRWASRVTGAALIAFGVRLAAD